ncbi:MAG: hypothetical protein ACP5NE_01260 [Candidatus Micrarchaeia archaeon]
MNKDATIKSHKPISYMGLRDGDYKLETYYQYYEQGPEVFNTAGQRYRLIQNNLYLVLGKLKGGKEQKIYTTYLESDSYVNDYIRAFLSMDDRDRILRLNSSAYDFYETIDKRKYRFPTVDSSILLLRLDKEQAFVLPGVEYKIKNINVTNSAVKVQLSFESKDGPRTMLLNAFIEPSSISSTDTAPYVFRLYNFFKSRQVYSISTSEPIPAIADATHINVFMKTLHAPFEEPVFKKGEVYVLDKVVQGENSVIYLQYHTFDLEHLLSEPLSYEKTELSPEKIRQLSNFQKVFDIATFSYVTKKHGRTEMDVYTFFNQKLYYGARLFSTFDDIYKNAMDYMRVPGKGKDIPPLVFKYYPSREGDPKGKKLQENVKLLREEVARRNYKERVVENGRVEIRDLDKRVP